MGDLGDTLELAGMREEPALYEQVVLEMQARAASDPNVATLLRSTYYDRDRDEAFERYLRSDEFSAILRVLDGLEVGAWHRLVEVGGGPGFLAYALKKRGYNVELVEPNGSFNTGTGYLRTRCDASDLVIWNDLQAWYSDRSKRYEVMLTHNCIHHFRPIQHVAACLRQKLTDDGRWLALKEWFADTPEETYRRLASHPWSQAYSLYEFPYPATQMIAAIEQAGFALDRVYSSRYLAGALNGAQLGGAPINEILTRLNDATNRVAPAAARVMLHLAGWAARRGVPRLQWMSRPSGMVFRRKPVGA